MSFNAFLLFCNILLAGIVAGGQVMVLAAIVPTRWLLPTREAVQLHQETSHRIDMFMPAAVILSAIAAILLLIPPVRGTSQVSPGFVVAGLAFTAVLGVLSLFVLIPINRRVSKWPIDAVPTEYSAVFHRWGRMHAWRTVCAVLALSAYLLATVVC